MVFFGFVSLFVSILLVTVLGHLLLWRLRRCMKGVCVVVLGDIGRSPRIQYHSLSLADAGFTVDVVGLGGSKPLEQLREHSSGNVHLLTLGELPWLLQARFIPSLLRYVLKALYQHMQLLLTLLFLTRRPAHFLLQSPPAIPMLSSVWLVCLLTGSRMIIDWHNYGFSILQLAVKPNHPLVFISKWYERFFGRLAATNICVTKAMREDLADNWGIRAITMYDRPPAMFKPTSIENRHELFLRLSTQHSVFKSESSSAMIGVETAFTKENDGNIELKSDRPFLIISSTSWTEDEDFSVLLGALEMYDQSSEQENGQLPSLVCIITGKGPLKSHYEKIIAEKKFEHVRFCLPWLEPEDYPLLLGSADLGVCLHVSSSGLDLPMKVVDMFGCGLPVCAIRFKCLHELVIHEHNGLVFDNMEELATHIHSLCRGFPARQEKLEVFRSNLKSFQNVRWQESWNHTVLPMFRV